MRRFLTLFSAFFLILALAACDSAEERAEEYYQSALELMEEGDYDRAMVELRNVFQLVQSHRDARFLMATILLEQRTDPSAAYGHFLRIAEQFPDDVEARIRLAQIAFQVGNWDELNRHGDHVIGLAPDNPDVATIDTVIDYQNAVLEEDASARRTIASGAETRFETEPNQTILREIVLDNAMRESEFSKALALLDTLTTENPEQTRYWNQRLQVLLALGDEAAIEEQLLRLVDLFPEESDRKAVLIQYYLARQEYDKTESFMRALVVDAEDGDLTPRADLIAFLSRFRSVEAALAEINLAIEEEDEKLPFIVLGATLDFASGNQDKAILELEAALDGIEPSETVNNAKIALAQMLLQTDNFVGARALVAEVLENDANQANALKMTARWQINADDPDGAIAGLRSALDQDPEDVEALSLMAEAYSRTGSLDLRRDFLSLAVEASGNAPEESIRYAQLLISEERFLPAEDVLLASLRVSPNNIGLLQTAAQLYLRMDDLGRAQQVVETLRRIETDEARQILIGLEAELLNRRAGADEALEFIEGIASGSEGDTASQILLLRALISTGDVEGAVAFAEGLVEADPDAIANRLVLAATVAISPDTERALSLYQELVDEFPENANLRLQVAGLQRRSGDSEAAFATVEEALEIAPDDPRILWMKASMVEEDGDIDAAIDIYELLYANLNQQGADSLVVANNLASLLATYRDDAESLERAWTIARRFRDAEIPAVQDTYGWIVHRRGDSEEALEYLQRAASGLSGDPVVQFHLAEALNATGQTEAALEQYRLVLSIAGAGDTRPQIETARARIAELEAAPAPTE